MSRFYPFYPYLFIFFCHFPLYYLQVINPNWVSMITWLYLISLFSYVTRSKYRCRLSGWLAEPALLVDRVYMGRTPFQGYSGVDYLDRMIPTFDKSFILPPTKLLPWQIGSTVCLLASLSQANLASCCQKLESLFRTQYFFFPLFSPQFLSCGFPFPFSRSQEPCPCHPRVLAQHRQ